MFCKCDCGAVDVLRRVDELKRSTKNGRAPACKGCVSQMKAITGLKKFKPEAYIARRFGRLLVTGVHIERLGIRLQSRLVCRCDCGARAVVAAMQLTSGKTTSCGCFHLERQVEVGQERVRHGHTTFGVLDGHTPLYRAWMKIRAGVREGWRAGFHLVCHEYDPRWDEFENFLQDFGVISAHETISRQDNQQPWSKENCFVNVGRRHLHRSGKPAASQEDLSPDVPE